MIIKYLVKTKINNNFNEEIKDTIKFFLNLYFIAFTFLKLSLVKNTNYMA